VFTYWWTIFCLILNFSGQIFLVINALAYHYDGLSSVALVFIMGICNRMWLVDDYLLLKSLKIMSKQKYEIGDALHEGDQRTAPRALGGSAVFALSVLNDADGELIETMRQIQDQKETAHKKSTEMETAIDMSTAEQLKAMPSATELSDTPRSLFKIDNLTLTEKALVITRSVLEEAAAATPLTPEVKPDVLNGHGSEEVILSNVQKETQKYTTQALSTASFTMLELGTIHSRHEQM